MGEISLKFKGLHYYGIEGAIHKVNLMIYNMMHVWFPLIVFVCNKGGEYFLTTS